MELSIQVDGRKIKILRKRRALTQTELGSTVMKQEGVKPISLRTIQKIENDDKYRCSMKVVVNLAKVLGVDLKELIPRKIQSPQPSKNSDLIIGPIYKGDTTVHVPAIKENYELYQNGEEENEEDEYVLNEQKIRLDEHMIRVIARECEMLFANLDIIEELRKIKFNVITFDSLMKLVDGSNSIKKNLDRSYNIQDKFRKALYIAEKEARHEGGTDNLWNIMYGDERFHSSWEVFDRDTTLRFFEKLSNAHWYSIDCDIPDDDETLSLMSELMDQIEGSFERGLRKSDELRIKFILLSTIKKLMDLRIGIFFGVREHSSEEWNTHAHRWDCFKSYSIRILIKYQKNKNFIMLSQYIDVDESEFYPPEKLFDRIDSRNFIEQYPEEEEYP